MQPQLRHVYEALGLGPNWLASHCGCSTKTIQNRLNANFPNAKLVVLNDVLNFLIANGNLPDGCEIVFPDGFLDRFRELQGVFAYQSIDLCQKQHEELVKLNAEIELLKKEPEKPNIDEAPPVVDVNQPVTNAPIDASQKPTGRTLEGLNGYVNSQLAIRDATIAELRGDVDRLLNDFVEYDGVFEKLEKDLPKMAQLGDGLAKLANIGKDLAKMARLEQAVDAMVRATPPQLPFDRRRQDPPALTSDSSTAQFDASAWAVSNPV